MTSGIRDYSWPRQAEMHVEATVGGAIEHRWTQMHTNSTSDVADKESLPYGVNLNRPGISVTVCFGSVSGENEERRVQNAEDGGGGGSSAEVKAPKRSSETSNKARLVNVHYCRRPGGPRSLPPARIPCVYGVCPVWIRWGPGVDPRLI